MPLTPTAMLSETLIGFAIGLRAALLVGAAEAMGDLLAVQIGLSGAAVLNPLTNQSVPVLGQFTNLFALALLLAVNAHLTMLDTLAASTRLLPVGGATDMPAGAAAMAGLGGSLFVLGLRFAAPVVAVVLLANAALAINEPRGAAAERARSGLPHPDRARAARALRRHSAGGHLLHRLGAVV